MIQASLCLHNIVSRSVASPWGGKLLAKRGDEGQPINRQLVSTPKSGISQASLAFPFGESGERMRVDRGQFKILALCQGFPLGGKLLAKRGDEGQSINRQLVSTPKSNIFQTSLAFPFGESGERMRADRGQFKILACFPLPVAKKIRPFRKKRNGRKCFV